MTRKYESASVVPGSFDRCPDCGASVYYADTEKHDEWHARLEKLERRVQHTSAMLSPIG